MKIKYKTPEAIKERIGFMKTLLWFLFIITTMALAFIQKLFFNDAITLGYSLIIAVPIFFTFLWAGTKILEVSFELLKEYDNLKYEENLIHKEVSNHE